MPPISKLAEHIEGIIIMASDLLDKEQKAQDLRKQGQPSNLYFAANYELWYSEALSIVAQVLPERREQFEACYSTSRWPPVQEMTAAHYTIADYCLGLVACADNVPLFDHDEMLQNLFWRQFAILSAAHKRVNSNFSDIKGAIEAEVLDDELDVARDLLGKQHLRSAGAIAGVVLERHLKHLGRANNVALRPRMTLTPLNDALKASGVYDQVQWRNIQVLGDIRNICAHDSYREPTRDEVEQLIRGVDDLRCKLP